MILKWLQICLCDLIDLPDILFLVLGLLQTGIHSLFGSLRSRSLLPLTALRLPPTLSGTLLRCAQAALGPQTRRRLGVAVAIRDGLLGGPRRLPVVVLVIVSQIGLHELNLSLQLFPL